MYTYTHASCTHIHTYFLPYPDLMPHVFARVGNVMEVVCTRMRGRVDGARNELSAAHCRHSAQSTSWAPSPALTVSQLPVTLATEKLSSPQPRCSFFCFPGEPETNSLSGERYHEQSSLHRRTQAYFSSHVSTAMTFSRHQQTCINTQLSVLLVRRPSMMPEFCGAGHSTRLVCVLAKYQLLTREHPDVNYILSVNPLVNGEGDDGYII